ncbi:MAG: trigger factor [Candidatus Limivicinus sp.]|nr:trigger factor [Clostridiales bacterium]MDY6133043.1 trigger factor [Candidatus Limivicinus sp.]
MIVKNVEKKENNTAVFQVESDAAEFEAAVNGVYLKNKASIYIPGFRKGKAPRAVVEGMYGKDVFYQDAMDELAPQAFEQGVKEAELRFVGAPSITDVNVTDERTAAYTFTVTLYPEVTLGQYKGIEATREPVTVSDEDVNAEVESARKRNARKVSVEREAQMGDTANIDFDGFLNGERFDGGKAEGYDLELGSNSFVPGFEEQIVGMQIGEEKDLDITFPEDYVEDLAGKAVVFKVKLNSLTVSELPELDDEFAKDVSEFDTLDEYKADIRANLEKRRQDEAEEKVRSEIMHKAAENMTVEIPEVMVQEKVEEILRNYAANFGLNSRDMEYAQLLQMMGLDENTVNVSIRPGAQVQVKNDLLIEAVIKAENIEATDEEVEEYLNKVAESIQAQPEEVKNYFGLEFLAGERKKEKATNLIIDSAVITEAAPEEEKAE